MSRGGARPGAGRKKTDRQPAKFYVTPIEKEYLKSCLIAFRRAEERKHEKFEEHMEKIGQQTLPLNSQEPAEASKARNRQNSSRKKKKTLRSQIWSCERQAERAFISILYCC